MSLKVGKYHFEFRHGWLDINVEVPHEETQALITEHLETLEKNPNDIATRFILGNVLRMDGQINKARLEYERVVQAKDSDWSLRANQILAQIEGQTDCPPPITTKYFYHIQIVPNPARTWRHMKLGIRRRLKRHRFITSNVTEADLKISSEDKQNLYYLKCEGKLLGLLKFDRLDFPWAYCHFQPTPAFEDVKTRFDEERNIARNSVKRWEAWYDNNIRILDLHLIEAATNREVKCSILHIQDGTAWFR
jgi:hypothetical protein